MIISNNRIYAGIALLNTLMFLVIIGIAYIYGLPDLGGWRFHVTIISSFIITTTIWFFIMYVMLRAQSRDNATPK